MTGWRKRTIIELAKAHLVRDEHTEFGWQECHKYSFDEAELTEFAALIAAHEREAIANICETLELPEWPDKVRQPLAQAIRARGNT